MKVTIVSVMSADGFTSRTDLPDDHSWTSPEDWQEFMQVRDAHDTLLMDEATYEQVKPEPSAALLRIVYAASVRAGDAVVPGQLEFTNSKPEELIAELEARGRQRLALVGGAELNAAFLQAGLVNELYLTYEPILFGGGPSFANGAELGNSLQLESVRQLNKRGTLLVHYTLHIDFV